MTAPPPQRNHDPLGTPTGPERPAPWPRAGDVVWIGPDASVQFAAPGFPFRVTKVDDRPTYEGWLWLAGYVLSPAGDAVIRRKLFVQRDGLRPALRYDGRHVGPGFGPDETTRP